MPAGLSQSDQRLLWITGALLLGLGAATVVLAPPQAQEQAVTPSTYSSASGGARAAYLLLQELHYPISRWEEPPTELQDRNAVLILAEPASIPTAIERKALRTFVQEGGRVLFCGSRLDSYFSGAHIDAEESGSPEWRSSPALIPSSFTRGAHIIAMRSVGRWRKLMPGQLPLYGSAMDPDVVLWRVGRGEIVWWRGASPLTNAGLGRANNLNVLLDAVAGRRIYWDEYFHGSRASLWSYVEQTPVKWALIQIALLLAAIVFTYSRRSGPVVTPAVFSRLSPLEFVDTLGSLYERAHAYEIAVSVPHRELRMNLERRLRLASDTTNDALAQAAAERLGWDYDLIAGALQAGSKDWNARKRSGKEALHVVRTMEQFTARLAALPPRESH